MALTEEDKYTDLWDLECFVKKLNKRWFAQTEQDDPKFLQKLKDYHFYRLRLQDIRQGKVYQRQDFYYCVPKQTDRDWKLNLRFQKSPEYNVACYTYYYNKLPLPPVSGDAFSVWAYNGLIDKVRREEQERMRKLAKGDETND